MPKRKTDVRRKAKASRKKARKDRAKKLARVQGGHIAPMPEPESQPQQPSISDILPKAP